jgi:hypothetical protein
MHALPGACPAARFVFEARSPPTTAEDTAKPVITARAPDFIRLQNVLRR